MDAILVPEHKLAPFHPMGIDAPPTAAPDGAASPFYCARSGGCVVAVADRRPDGANAAWRGAAVARDLGLPLRLLLTDVRFEELRHAQGVARHLAHQAAMRLGVQATGDAVTGELHRALAEMAPRPALVVLQDRRGNMFSDALLGTAAERLFRAAFTPMLIVKRPAATSYRRVLVAAQLEASAALLLDAAQGISRDPRIAVMHVIEPPEAYTLRVGDVPRHALNAHQRRRTAAAWNALHRLIAAAGASERTKAHVTAGHAPGQVLEAARASRAQLVVIGKRRRTLREALLADGVSRRLVREGRADVLMLPLG